MSEERIFIPCPVADGHIPLSDCQKTRLEGGIACGDEDCYLNEDEVQSRLEELEGERTPCIFQQQTKREPVTITIPVEVCWMQQKSSKNPRGDCRGCNQDYRFCIGCKKTKQELEELGFTFHPKEGRCETCHKIFVEAYGPTEKKRPVQPIVQEEEKREDASMIDAPASVSIPPLDSEPMLEEKAATGVTSNITGQDKEWLKSFVRIALELLLKE